MKKIQLKVFKKKLVILPLAVMIIISSSVCVRADSHVATYAGSTRFETNLDLYINGAKATLSAADECKLHLNGYVVYSLFQRDNYAYFSADTECGTYISDYANVPYPTYRAYCYYRVDTDKTGTSVTSNTDEY